MYYLIVNPAAGNGRTLKTLSGVKDELDRLELAHEIHITQRPGHATQIAGALAADGREAHLVVLGGDGTFSEVANGIAGTRAIMYFVSCGTGNDFVKVLRLPKDPIEALRTQLSCPPRAIDAGRVNDIFFLNISGTGFDIEVLRQTKRFSARFKGLVPYLMGLFAALGRYRPVEATITLNNKRFRKKLTLFEVANGRYFGGGMLVAPEASPFDGLFDIVYVEAVSRPKILALLPLFVTGKFLSLPIVHTVRADEIIIEAPGLTLNLDGELRQIDRAHYRMMPGGLRIACP